MSIITKSQAKVIIAVTFGNILEWYEIYSYAYLAPMLAKLFFHFDSSLTNLISAFIIFGSGFLTRPFGAIIFGRLGDLVGRKQAFVLSITVMTIPTFLMGCLPTYAAIGVGAPILLGGLRLLQSIPAAGEVPGTICYLYENSEPANRKFITSWTGVGNQIGAILGLIETFLMDQFLTEDFMMSWGWRISFWSGGIIGLFGIYLRKKLFETPMFNKLKSHHNLDKETISEVIKNHKKTISIGIGYSIINAATFYLIATYVPTFFGEKLGLSPQWNIILSLSIVTLTTVPLPFLGLLGDKFKIKPFLIYSSLSIVLLLYPLYISINQQSLFFLIIMLVIYIIPITVISAFLPYLLARLFPTPVRFTGIALAFNLSDGIIGGFTPAIALLLLQYSGNQAAFCWYILAVSVISIITYLKIKE